MRGIALERYTQRLKHYLRAQCQRLSPKARKRLLYGMATAYLIATLSAVIQSLCLKGNTPRLPIPRAQYLGDSASTLKAERTQERLRTLTQQITSNYEPKAKSTTQKRLGL